MRRTRSGYGNSVQFRHRMEGLTSLADGHRHAFGKLTDVFIPENGSHRHTFRGITTTEDGHRHSYSGRTGLNIHWRLPHNLMRQPLRFHEYP